MYTIADRIYLALLWFKTFQRERRRWNASAGLPGAPRVFYGVDHIPGINEKASGGVIKCQDLGSRFPNISHDANILYWVSSTLPHHAPLITKYARKAGLKIVLNQNGVGYPAWHGAGWKEFNRPMAYIHRVADHVFYQSDFCRLSAERHLGRRNGPGEVLYNAVDTEVFTSRDSSVGDKTAPVLLVSGSHHGRYRVEGAIEALRLVRQRIPGARLIVAGRYCWIKDEKAALQEVQALAQERGVGDAIEWRKSYTQAEAPALLRGANILIHSKYNDCCPRLVLEAMSCGLPVVYSGSGGMPELVGSEAGIGIPAPLDWEREHPPEPAALGDAICMVAANLPQFSNAARQRAVDRFDIKPWLKRHSDIFNKLSLDPALK